MDLPTILSNLLSPPILFFFLGMIACFVGSDLEVPPPFPKFFSLYPAAFHRVQRRRGTRAQPFHGHR